jgi:hypothetical protein
MADLGGCRFMGMQLELNRGGDHSAGASAGASGGAGAGAGAGGKTGRGKSGGKNGGGGGGGRALHLFRFGSTESMLSLHPLKRFSVELNSEVL